MRKIPTLYVRDPRTNYRHVMEDVTPGCEWVLEGEGRPTRKYDGTCRLVRDDQLFKRHEVRPTKRQPADFIQVDHDEETGKRFGWVPVRLDEPGDCWHVDAWERLVTRRWLERAKGPEDGTYELVGPKVQGNPEGYPCHELVAHADAFQITNAPRDFESLRVYLTSPLFTYEGIVWHHPDGRMAKLKKRDFPTELL